MFGQFVVHLDYMLSVAGACQPVGPKAISGTLSFANRGLPGFFVG